MCAILYQWSCGKTAFQPHFTRFLSRGVSETALKSPFPPPNPRRGGFPSSFRRGPKTCPELTRKTPPNAIMEAGSIVVSCAVCEIRKEKRFCPAVHGRICPQCCGEQREVTLDCPSDCPYLQQAREHEKPRSSDDLDPASLFLQVELADQFLYEHEHLIMGLSFALWKAARSDRTITDRDLIAGVTALARNYERLVNSSCNTPGTPVCATPTFSKAWSSSSAWPRVALPAAPNRAPLSISSGRSSPKSNLPWPLRKNLPAGSSCPRPEAENFELGIGHAFRRGVRVRNGWRLQGLQGRDGVQRS